MRYSSSDKKEWPLLPIDKQTFVMIRASVKPIVQFDSKKQQMTVQIENSLPGVFTFLQSNLDEKRNDLKIFEGSYYSPELKTSYSIFTDDKSNIYIEHARHGSIKLKQLYNTIFLGDWPVGIVEIKKNDEGKVLGLRMSNGRTRNVWFKKVV